MGGRNGQGSPVLVTGGAGFLGSHLCERLLSSGREVVCVDDLSTGVIENIEPLMSDPAFEFVNAEIPSQATADLLTTVHPRYVIHLASPASPVDFDRIPIRILQIGAYATDWALQLAWRNDARFVLASTSEVYGTPEVHPQVESYWGNVNPVGVRSVYDEAKRYAEALAMAYHRQHGTNIAIARFFNTYGPRMRADDGRLIPQLISEALTGLPLTIHGDGQQTRSLCYVDDLVDGIVLLMESDVRGPINLGNPEEYTVEQVARVIATTTGTEPRFAHTAPRTDDPVRRRPDISLAQSLLGWQPRTSVRAGIRRTVDWYADRTPRLTVSARSDG
ncbi:NAD-dependent epimerase/dehydratase family protein [Amycolatopsis sp. TNS106]|uniref:NAD-dependent epimerase/dehydratase family protein n=1 Tax=Amycolatopsis sp. TNS106 TaxID=2861750 RepID=UPI001C59FA38|nr:NAD-dependent epimerase/dehydratase family protein [Amycolatopsis sp. TNS106]QXV56945.1 hypothetical protein CVV72_07940 [Amycolatopsis sp. TNS106]